MASVVRMGLTGRRQWTRRQLLKSCNPAIQHLSVKFIQSGTRHLNQCADLSSGMSGMRSLPSRPVNDHDDGSGPGAPLRSGRPRPPRVSLQCCVFGVSWSWNLLTEGPGWGNIESPNCPTAGAHSRVCANCVCLARDRKKLECTYAFLSVQMPNQVKPRHSANRPWSWTPPRLFRQRTPGRMACQIMGPRDLMEFNEGHSRRRCTVPTTGDPQ